MSAVFLLFGLPPAGLWVFSFLGFLPLFLLALDPGLRTRRLFLHAWTVGMIYYGLFFWWLLLYQARIFLIVWLIFAPVFAIYFFAFRLLISKTASSGFKIITASLLWILLGKLFAMTPLTRAPLEIPFYGPLPFLQTASVTDFSVFAGIVTGMNAAGALLIRRRTFPHLAWFAGLILFLALIYVWGDHRLQESSKEQNIKVALVQHNFPISDTWRQSREEYIFSQFERLTSQAAKESPDLLLFPLYTIPGDPLRKPAFFLGLARRAKAHILLAAHIPRFDDGDPKKGLMDTAILYSPEGTIGGTYQATQAPPFRKISEVTAGRYELLRTPFGKLGILLCYEDCVPGIARKAVLEGADILVSISNPGHFTSTHLPYYHLLQDRLRAIENNRFLLRVSTNGYSAIIDPKGKILGKSRLAEECVLSGKV